jgi:hypothetical protein
VFICFSEAARELQIDILKLPEATGGFIKPPGEYAQISSRKSVENSEAF